MHFGGKQPTANERITRKSRKITMSTLGSSLEQQLPKTPSKSRLTEFRELRIHRITKKVAGILFDRLVGGC